MWKVPWQLKVNTSVSSMQFLLHSQSMKEGPQLCLPSCIFSVAIVSGLTREIKWEWTTGAVMSQCHRFSDTDR